MEETLNNEPQNQSIIQYIKSGVNVTINLNAISSDEINLNDIQRLINNSEQLQLPLNLYVSGGSSFGGSDESKIDMLFDEKTLKKIIHQTSFSAAVNLNRPILTGVQFAFKDDVLECVATDSFRLSKCFIEMDQSIEPISFTIPKKSRFPEGSTPELSNL